MALRRSVASEELASSDSATSRPTPQGPPKVLEPCVQETETPAKGKKRPSRDPRDPLFVDDPNFDSKQAYETWTERCKRARDEEARKKAEDFERFREAYFAIVTRTTDEETNRADEACNREEGKP